MSEAALRAFLEARPPARIAAWVRPSAPEQPSDLGRREIAHALACPCGSVAFRLLGVPAAMSRRGGGEGGAAAGRSATRGFVLRSVLRLWRELQMAAGAQDASVLLPPIILECARCRARHLLDAPGSRGTDAASAPLEALRCRPCRRSSFEATFIAGYETLDFEAAPRPGDEERFVAWRLRVRCRTCGRTDHPVSGRLRDARQIALDSLYGRDDAGRAVDPDEPAVSLPDERSPR